MHHLRLFGVPQLVDPFGEAVKLRTRKHLALLTCLALDGRTRAVPRATLTDLLWSGATPERARHSLSQSLSALRQVLGRDAFTRSSVSVKLIGTLSTDLEGGRYLEIDPADLASPLAGIDACAGPSFAHWVDATRIHCSQWVKQRLLTDFAEARRRGQLDVLGRLARLLYAVDPYSDAAARILAEQHLLSGDGPAAILLLARHIDRGRSDLGREAPDLASLLRRLQKGWATSALEGKRRPSEAQPLLDRPDVFVGREEELARCESLWARAMHGRLVTCLVSAPAGIGKSALVRRFAASLSVRTWTTFVVRCQEIGASIPFATISDLIQQLTCNPALSGTDPAWLAEASRVTPALRTLFPGMPDPPNTPAEAVRVRVAEAIARMFEAVADGAPVFLAFDDVQHVDPASRDVLHVLARRMEETPTMLLGAFRSSETEGAYRWAEAHDLLPWNCHLVLKSLDPSHIREMIRRLSADGGSLDARVADKIVKLAYGNPYLAELLLADWRHNPAASIVTLEPRNEGSPARWRPPEALRTAFARQYRGLSQAGQRVLHLLAVSGREMPTSEIATVLALSAGESERTALELIDRAIVRVDRGALSFKNELHSAFTYYAMPDENRNYLHARLATAVLQSHDPQDFQRALESAHHFLRAGMIDKSVATLLVGADLAIKRGAAKEAEHALRRIMHLGVDYNRPYLSVRLAQSLAAQQRYKECIHTLDIDVPAHVDPQTRAMIAGIKAEALQRGRLGSTEAIYHAAARAVSAAADADDEELEIAAHQISAEAGFEHGDWQAVRNAELACEHRCRASARLEISALAQLTLGFCRLVTANYRSACEALQLASTAFDSLGHSTRLHRALNGLGMCYTGLENHQSAIAALSRASDIATEISDLPAKVNIMSNLAALYFERGHLARAAHLLSEALSIDEHSLNERVTATVCCNAAHLAIVRGDLTEANQLLDRAARAAAQSQLWYHAAMTGLTRADVQLASGQPELAWHQLQDIFRIIGERWSVLPDVGQYFRLRLQYAQATGETYMSPIDYEVPRQYVTLRRVHLLEAQAALECGGAERTNVRSKAIDELVTGGYFGVVAKLIAAQLPLPSLPPLRESAAAYVARHFHADKESGILKP